MVKYGAGFQLSSVQDDHQQNRLDHSVEIIGKKESKHLPDIIIKKQNMSLVTAAGMTEVFHHSNLQ